MSVEPERLDHLLRQLHALAGGHRHDMVADTATKILALDPQNRDALINLAVAQYQQARLAESDEAFARMRQTTEYALSIYPTEAYLYYLLHLYYLWYGGDQYVDARDCILNAIKLDPQNGWYYRQLGEIYLINREADKAVGYLQEAVRLAPEEAEYRSRLALALLRQRKVRESIALAEQALKDAPDNMSVLDTVGMIYILLGDLEKADRFFRDAIKRDPTYNYFHQHMDWLKRELRDKGERERQGKKYTALYIRQKGSKRFFDEDSVNAAP
jgi:tetratricopeptide (TPR) repeat protein